MVPRGGAPGFLKRLKGQSIFGSDGLATRSSAPPGLLQLEVLPGTSTLRAMQEEGAVSAMTLIVQKTPKTVENHATRRVALRIAAAALLGATLAACTGEQFQRGYILPPGALEQIPIGASQDQVLIVMGTPSTVATLNGEVFYYISQRSERKVAFMNQQVIDQRVIAIYFDQDRRVRRIANYGLQDGRIFDFISRTTPTSGQELSYLTPLFKIISPR
jgi:outer membrane protein assembly factor BamE (lipoprotein component of BamABCDE complex)